MNVLKRIVTNRSLLVGLAGLLIGCVVGAGLLSVYRSLRQHVTLRERRSDAHFARAHLVNYSIAHHIYPRDMTAVVKWRMTVAPEMSEGVEAFLDDYVYFRPANSNEEWWSPAQIFVAEKHSVAGWRVAVTRNGHSLHVPEDFLLGRFEQTLLCADAGFETGYSASAIEKMREILKRETRGRYKTFAD